MVTPDLFRKRFDMGKQCCSDPAASLRFVHAQVIKIQLTALYERSTALIVYDYAESVTQNFFGFIYIYKDRPALIMKQKSELLRPVFGAVLFKQIRPSFTVYIADLPKKREYPRYIPLLSPSNC